jgi:hypothetical protein
MNRIFSNKNLIWETILISSIILIIIILYFYKQSEYKIIARNAGYSIGTILKYNERTHKNGISGGSAHTTTIPAYIEFKYNYKDTILFNYYSENSFYIPANSVKVGEKFLVAYSKDKPQKSMVLFDKPIRDSSDYKRYLLENNVP